MTMAEDRCDEPVRTGTGTRKIVRWAFIDGVCRKFTYSGRGRNGNNFK